MSESESDHELDAPTPTTTVVYPVGEETEVPNTKGNLFKTVLVEGTGALPPRNSKVTVSYKGTLLSDGSCFDSSDSFEFKLGVGQVIKGWDQGVATMRKGERAVLKCLPEYAYGKSGSPPKIPGDSTLLFEVELKNWEKREDISKDKDQSLMKTTTAEGKNWDHPEYESTVNVSVKIFVAGQPEPVFAKDAWEFVVGDVDIPQSLEDAICSMKEKEEAVVECTAAANRDGHEGFSIPPGAEATYHLSLHSLRVVKTWNYKGAEKVEQGKIRKDQGNEYFKQQEWAKAEKKYRRCLEFVEYDYGLEGDAKEMANSVKTTVRGNLAQVLLNTKRYREALGECEKILKDDGGNSKALFRRGKAHSMLDEWSEAKRDFQRILDMQPDNADALRELNAVIAKERDYDRKLKGQFAGMFAKLSAMEEKERAQKPLQP
jgi:tetratricopeptide (TPR) repeat protein